MNQSEPYARELDDRLTIVVSDTKSGESFERQADGGRALDVLYHPCAYAFASGLAGSQGPSWTIAA